MTMSQIAILKTGVYHAEMVKNFLIIYLYKVSKIFHNDITFSMYIWCAVLAYTIL